MDPTPFNRTLTRRRKAKLRLGVPLWRRARRQARARGSDGVATLADRFDRAFRRG